MRFYAIILFVAIFNLSLNIVGALNIFGYEIHGSFGFPYSITLAIGACGALALPLVYTAHLGIAVLIFSGGFLAMIGSVNNTLSAFGMGAISAGGGLSIIGAFDILMGILAVAAIIQILSGGWKTYE